MPFANNNGVKIYYESTGTGTPLVLIIGIGGTSDAWKYHIPVFAPDYQVITFDNRGAGRSDKPDIPYSMEMFAGDVKTVLDDLKIKQAVILGLSMGGLIAQEFYHQYPKRVKALILGCTGVGAGDPKFIYPGISVLNFLAFAQKDDPDFYERFARYFYHSSFREKVPDLANRIRKSAGEPECFQPAYAYKRQMEACMVKKLNYSRLQNIKVKTLVIHGEDDLIWPIENAKYLAENIPGAELEIIPDCGHMFFLEVFEEFNKRISGFLKKLKL